MNNVRAMNYEILHRLNARGIEMDLDDVNTLRRAELTLHRWNELECGSERGCVVRDEETGKTYWQSAFDGRLYATPDRETGALKRVENVCAKYGLYYYYQSDPRGGSLYVSREKLDGSNYPDKGVYVGGD